MNQRDLATLTATLAPILRELVDAAVQPLARRLDDLAALPKVPTAEEVAALLPAPKDGRDGADGKSITADDCRPLIDEFVQQAVSALSRPKDGEPGPRGDKGDTGERGEKGEKGEAGPDGVGLAGALIDRDGNLVLTLTDGKAVSLGTVIGKDGANGKDGRDGLGFSDLDVADEDGTFVLTFTRDDQVKTFRIRKPTLADAYRGIWKDGAYKAGDLVTWAGSLFIARRDTLAKPESNDNDDWRLAVKRGRDGKDGELKAPRAQAKVTL